MAPIAEVKGRQWARRERVEAAILQVCEGGFTTARAPLRHRRKAAYVLAEARSARGAAGLHGTHESIIRKIPNQLWEKAADKLDLLDAAKTLVDLRVPPGNRLERLKGDLSGYHSIRINDQWRIIFRWEDGDAYEVKIVDYH